jgi:hypothetical protein
LPGDPAVMLDTERMLLIQISEWLDQAVDAFEGAPGPSEIRGKWLALALRELLDGNREGMTHALTRAGIKLPSYVERQQGLSAAEIQAHHEAVRKAPL